MGKAIYKLVLLVLVLGAGLFTTSKAEAQTPSYFWSVTCHANVTLNGQYIAPNYEGTVGVYAPYRPGETLSSDAEWDLKGRASAECTQKVRDFYKKRCGSLNLSGTINWGVGGTLQGWIGSNYWNYYPPLFVYNQIFVTEVCGLRTPPDDRPCRRPCP